MLKDKSLIYVPDRIQCKVTGRLVRRYQTQTIDLHNQMNLFAEKEGSPGKKVLYFVAIIDNEKILSFHIVEAVNKEEAKVKFKAESLYSYLMDQLMVMPFRDLKGGYKWEVSPF